MLTMAKCRHHFIAIKVASADAQTAMPSVPEMQAISKCSSRSVLTCALLCGRMCLG